MKPFDNNGSRRMKPTIAPVSAGTFLVTRRPGAFTLIQLLVLVASIAILTAMLLLSLGSAWDSSNPGSTIAAPSNSISPPPSLQSEDRVYPVGRRLRDFPEKEDLSTPEAALAGSMRAYVRGDSQRPYLIKRLADQQPPQADRKPLPEDHARSWLNLEIIEVRIHEGNSAAVFCWQPGFWGAYFDTRFLELHKGNWLNAGSSPIGQHSHSQGRFRQLVSLPGLGSSPTRASEGSRAPPGAVCELPAC